MSDDTRKVSGRRHVKRWLLLLAVLLLFTVALSFITALLSFRIPESLFIGFSSGFLVYLLFVVPSSETALPAPFSQVKVPLRERLLIVAMFIALVVGILMISYLFDSDTTLRQRVVIYGGGVLGFLIGFLAVRSVDAFLLQPKER